MLTIEFPCPSCRRISVVDRSTPEAARCSRCGCELLVLVHLREVAAARARQAVAALESGIPAEAAHLAVESWSLKPGSEAAACGLLAGVVGGDLAAAALWKRRLETASAD